MHKKHHTIIHGQNNICTPSINYTHTQNSCRAAIYLNLTKHIEPRTYTTTQLFRIQCTIASTLPACYTHFKLFMHIHKQQRYIIHTHIHNILLYNSSSSMWCVRRPILILRNLSFSHGTESHIKKKKKTHT